MRFEVAVINYYFYNEKMSLARNLKLPALLEILGFWQTLRLGGDLSIHKPRAPAWQGNQRGGGEITYFNNVK